MKFVAQKQKTGPKAGLSGSWENQERFILGFLVLEFLFFRYCRHHFRHP